MRSLSKLTLILALALLAPGLASAQCTFTTIDTTMILDGNCTTTSTILIPDGFTLDGASHTITAEDPAEGHFLGAVVKNGGMTAHVKNLTIVASQLANVCDGGGPPDNRLRGILFDGAEGTITSNTVVDINQFFATGGSGCQEGNGIEVRNAPFDGTHPNTKTVTISGNTISNYQKTGIVANGDVAVTVTDNVVEGFGAAGFIAQNGIQLGFGATGIVMGNEVSGNWFSGANWVATGVLAFQANDAMVHQNTIDGNQTGVAIESWCFLDGPATASENRVVQNQISGTQYGVTVLSFDFFSSCNPSVDNNKVVNNIISGSNGDTGVTVGAFDLDLANSISPSAINNKVIRNSISGFLTAVDDTGMVSKIRANVVEP